MPLVSVLVPVYKVEKYLTSCINSILTQTFTDFELILIDDGSPDRSGMICDDFANRDKRIRVVHQENKTLPAVRNLGISMARGNFICFVDSDDLIHPRMLELLCSVLEKSAYPFVHCAFHRFFSDAPELPLFSDSDAEIKVEELTSEEGIIRMMDGEHYGHYVWKGMYRRNYIQQFSFPMRTRWQSMGWSADVVGNAGCYAYVPLDLYAYRIYHTKRTDYQNWPIQRLYYDAYLDYIEKAEHYAPNSANSVRVHVFHSFTLRDFTLEQDGLLSDEARREIAQMAKATHVNIHMILTSDLPLRRKCMDSMYCLSFPFGRIARTCLMKHIEG
jgi:glycosyltransferase involved in cell wall biosynthesis